MIIRTFHTRDKIETKELTQDEVEQFWKNFKDEECRVELLRQAYEKAVDPIQKTEILAQVAKMKPTAI